MSQAGLYPFEWAEWSHGKLSVEWRISAASHSRTTAAGEHQEQVDFFVFLFHLFALVLFDWNRLLPVESFY